MAETVRRSHAGILLAAGNSTRMGVAKQLLDFHGKPLVRHAAETLLAAGCTPVVVVTGAREQHIRSALDGLPVELVHNPAWDKGIGASIRTGIEALSGHNVGGAILILSDQPFVTPDMLAALAAKHLETGCPVVASRYSGTVGVPAYFASRVFHLLTALQPEEGCKRVILGQASSATLLDCPEAAIDIDTPADYARAIAPEPSRGA